MGLRGESSDLEGKERQVVSEAERKLGSPVIEEMSSQKFRCCTETGSTGKLFEIC